MAKQWFPLESNPEVMTNYVSRLGVDMTDYQFHDVLSTEDWALEMVPQPVLGVLMLFPIKEATEKSRKEQKKHIEENGQTVSPKCYFMKQTVGNACGTVGLLHCILNARDRLKIDSASYIESLIESTSDKSPDERAEIIASDDRIDAAHESAAISGQSVQINEEVDTHFICFTQVDGHLYELDGRKAFPINHGTSTPETLLVDACKVIREEFMNKDPDEVRFTIVALGPRQPEE